MPSAGAVALTGVLPRIRRIDQLIGSPAASYDAQRTLEGVTWVPGPDEVYFCRLPRPSRDRQVF